MIADKFLIKWCFIGFSNWLRNKEFYCVVDSCTLDKNNTELKKVLVWLEHGNNYWSLMYSKTKYFKWIFLTLEKTDAIK